MRRTLGLITALLLAAPAVILTQGNPDRPFRFQGRTWVNQEAFIASGGRCATRNLTPERRDQVDQEIAAHLKKGGGPPAVTGGVIDVWFHVITSASGQGNVPDNQINNQMNVLNAAFANWGWTFNLAGVDRTANNAWFAMEPGTTAERDAKAALRQGSADDLNIYSANPGGGLLGWATFPSSYASKPSDDGVVVLFSSLPGGIGGAVQPGRHGDARGRTLDGPVSHVPGRLQQQERYGRRHAPPSGARRSAARPDATHARAAGLDPIENFMDYTDDACMFQFTAGQDARMDAQFSTYRFGK